MSIAFGIDIGGTGIKGAAVDLSTGELTSERFRLDTPSPGDANAVLSTVATVVEMSGWDGPVGCTFPGIIKHGVIGMTANVPEDLLGLNLSDEVAKRIGHPAHAVNDADAAGIAEMRLGAGRGVGGVVMMLTLGTGIGSALFIDGVLVPNTELGHLHLDGSDNIESRTSAKARKREGLSYQEWAVRLQSYFSHVERLFSPDLFIVGGGVSRKAEKFLPLLDLRTPIVPAELRQNSGIVGAALIAQV